MSVQVAIHQPHFLPWLKYLNKVATSEVFVILDDVQFRRRYYQNRAKIKIGEQDRWLTVPLKKQSQSTLIKDIEINRDKEYDNILKTIQANYSKSNYFKDYFDDIATIINKDFINLNDLNNALLYYFFDLFEFKTKVYKSSDLQIDTDNPNTRLLEICKKFNADKYIAGAGGKNYMDVELFNQNNIEVVWQEYPIDTEYNQLGKNFVAGLSVLDVLFNTGKEETTQLIFNSKN